MFLQHVSSLVDGSFIAEHSFVHYATTQQRSLDFPFLSSTAETGAVSPDDSVGEYLKLL